MGQAGGCLERPKEVTGRGYLLLVGRTHMVHRLLGCGARGRSCSFSVFGTFGSGSPISSIRLIHIALNYIYLYIYLKYKLNFLIRNVKLEQRACLRGSDGSRSDALCGALWILERKGLAHSDVGQGLL